MAEEIDMSFHPEAARMIRDLELEPHPEGGWFREVWRSPIDLCVDGLLPGMSGRRAFKTTIYYLLSGNEVSRLHRLKSTEIWHLYAGGPLAIHCLGSGPQAGTVILGGETPAGPRFQAVVEGGCWFGAELVTPGSFALAGCTMAPGFHSDDFQLGERRLLLKEFPEHADLIARLTPAAEEESL